MQEKKNAEAEQRVLARLIACTMCMPENDEENEEDDDENGVFAL